MRKVIKKIIPLWLIKTYRRLKSARFKNKAAQTVFTTIYATNYWNSAESVSGTGSELAQTQTLLTALETLFSDFEIHSVLDIPCGDFNWMQHCNLTNIDYIGADIVADLILKNREKYADKGKLKFEVLNLITDPLPPSDLIMVRDCLVHLSFADIAKALQNIKSSGAKYLLTTTFTANYTNYDITTGDWRRLNLQLPPFSFPLPLLLINENCTEDDGAYTDKSMALWRIIDL
jgi:hypothetical protein